MIPFGFAHCDTMDGPVIKDARKALETKNVDVVLKWVQRNDEAEIRNLFDKTMAVRALNPQAKELADMYFFESLVRIHRAGEGASFDGIKPSGTEVEPGIEAADQAVESGLIGPVAKETAEHMEKSIRSRFAELQERKEHVDDSVEAGREYVKSYVTFIHDIENLHQIVSQNERHGEKAGSPIQHVH